MNRYSVRVIWRGECSCVVAARNVLHVEAKSEADARAAARRLLRDAYARGGEVASVEAMA